MLFLEIFLSIQCLLFLSSWIIDKSWLINYPSIKLKLVRLLLVSCVVSPFLVHCFSSPYKPERQHYLSIDTLQEYANKPILKAQPFERVHTAATTFEVDVSYCQIVYLVFLLLILFRAYQLISGLQNVRTLLAESIPYRRVGKLHIKVSEHCHVPFSVFLWNKAYMAQPQQNEDCTFIIRRISMLSKYPLCASKSWVLGLTIAGASVLAPICMAYTAVGSLAYFMLRPADLSHLDSKLQKIAESEIQEALKKYHATSAVIAVAILENWEFACFS